jgi:hypothetical protein
LRIFFGFGFGFLLSFSKLSITALGLAPAAAIYENANISSVDAAPIVSPSGLSSLL